MKNLLSCFITEYNLHLRVMFVLHAIYLSFPTYTIILYNCIHLTCFTTEFVLCTVFYARALKRNFKEQALLPIVRHYFSDEDSKEEIKDENFWLHLIYIVIFDLYCRRHSGIEQNRNKKIVVFLL